MKMTDVVEFTVRCRMKRGCADAFLSMLDDMYRLGRAGCSRIVSFDADGDGIYRPVFETDYEHIPIPVCILEDDGGSRHFSQETEWDRREEEWKRRGTDVK